MTLDKKPAAGAILVRAAQSLFLAAEIAVLADFLFAAGEWGLPRSAFWSIFIIGAAALFALRGFTRRARRIAALSLAGAAALALLGGFAAWRLSLPAAAYKTPETEP